jgi:hypothetical protein
MTREEVVNQINARRAELFARLEALVASGGDAMEMEALVDLFNDLGSALDRLRGVQA